MPLARISIEQIEIRKWVAEVEAGGQPGGPPFKMLNAQPQSGDLRAGTFDEIMAKIAAAYYRQVPPAAPVVVRVSEEVAAVVNAALRNAPPAPIEAPVPRFTDEVAAIFNATVEPVVESADSERDALREQARTLGIDVDNRWGATRLQAEIQKARGETVIE